MKLFNINIDFKTIQEIFILIIILLLVFYCIYILYFSSNPDEGFANCSNCQMKPSSGDCMPIYDFSYTPTAGQGYKDLSLIDTSYIFCPWEANCTRDDYLANMDDQDTRLALSNEDFEYNKGHNNITCCSGIINDDGVNFYQEYSSSFFDNNYTSDALQQCSSFNEYVIDNRGILKNSAFSSSSKRDVDTNTFFRYKQQICDRQDFSGILFEKSVIDHSNILLDPDLTFQELKDYQNTLEFSYNTLPNGTRRRIPIIYYGDISFTIDQINDQLKQLTTNPSQIQSIQGYSKLELQTMLSKFFANDISYQDISYIPVNSSFVPIINSINNSQYLLNEEQFFNCFGDIKDICANNTGIGSQFEQNIQSDILDNINYFDVSDTNIKTASELTPNNYGPKNDLEMELANLQSVQPGGTAPVSVINQYLNAINGFYENQIQNLIGPRTHAINDQIVFDNNTLETKTNTFLTYENDANNSYQCNDSVTQDNKFKYCGPTPYYSDLKL
jgi:hypothetical protein